MVPLGFVRAGGPGRAVPILLRWSVVRAPPGATVLVRTAPPAGGADGAVSAGGSVDNRHGRSVHATEGVDDHVVHVLRVRTDVVAVPERRLRHVLHQEVL